MQSSEKSNLWKIFIQQIEKKKHIFGTIYLENCTKTYCGYIQHLFEMYKVFFYYIKQTYIPKHICYFNDFMEFLVNIFIRFHISKYI